MVQAKTHVENSMGSELEVTSRRKDKGKGRVLDRVLL